MDKKPTYEELRQRVKEQEEKERKYRKLFEEALDGIIVADAETGVIVDCNHAAAELVGRDRSEIIGLHQKVLHPSLPDHERFSETFERHLQESEGQVLETQVITGTGEIKEVAIKANRIRMGDRVFLQGIFRDITAQKEAGALLRANEEKYRDLYENAPIAYFSISAVDGSISRCNTAAVHLLGYDKETLMGMKVFDLYAATPYGLARAQDVFTHFKSGESIKDAEMQMRHKDGHPIWISLSVVPVRDSEGNITESRSMAIDISDRKDLEAQIQYTQRMEAIGTLAGGIAHNFNNILASITANVELGMLDVGERHPNYGRFQSIKKIVKKGAKLTGQLLGYARGGRYEVKPISVNRLLRETSETFGETRKEIRIHQELAEDLRAIEADQGQIEQVLLNLYVNAADAMPTGGDLFLKTVNVTDKNMKHIPYKPKKGDYVLLSVRDTGVGIDKENMARVFDPFFTTKGLAEGTGLGLASTYGIIKGHGGHIDVDSERGKGTTFTIYLPATEKELKREKKEPSGELLKGKETILLVDDERSVLDASEEMLKRLGYSVLSAGSGPEALRLYERHQDKIDMVLLDIVMPGMGGGEVYGIMKTINPKVKVLLSSGYDAGKEADAILKGGSDGFIQKPFFLKQLSQEIRKILDEE
jgi:two-component system cell cycle sensor histidine kinase/response regulator CckA